jgi:multiple sugar transport system permease protein
MRKLGVVQYIMTMPANTLIVVFILLPALYVIWLSLTKSSYGQIEGFVGLANYGALLGDRNFWLATLNTFIVVNVIVYLELMLALILAQLLVDGIPFRRLVVTILLLPHAVSEVVGVLMVKYMFEPEVGMVSYLLTSLGLPQLEWTINPSHALSLVVLLSVWRHLPFTFIIVYTARLTLPAELYEAARNDGAGAWQRFVHITLPLLMPSIMVALLFRYIFAFRLFPEVWLLTQGGPARQTEVLAVYLYKQAFRYYDFGVASATAWAMTLLSLLIALLYIWTMYRRMLDNAQ